MKNCRLPRWFVGLMVASAVGWIPSSSTAQVLGLGELSGDLTTTFQYNRDSQEPGGSSFQNILSRSQLNLRDTGYIIDPRLVTFSAMGGLGFSQRWESGSGSSGSNNELLWNYAISAHILPQKKLSLILLADRTQLSTNAAFAGQVDSVSQNLQGQLLVSHLYIPSTFSFRQESRDTESTSRGITSRTRYERNVFRYEGRRGWLDQELHTRYEYVDYKDEINSASSYGNHEGNLAYSIDFGTALSWHSNSGLNFSKRSGATDQLLVNAREGLQIDHSDRFRTFYDYNFSRTDQQGRVTTTQSGNFSLTHRLYESLTTSARLAASFSDFEDGRQNQYSGGALFSYTKKLPLGGILNAGLGGNLSYNSSRFSAAENFVSQETHSVATPFALPIPLNNPTVVASSVIVTKIAFGPLPIGCLPPPGPPTDLVLGTDYTLRQVGDVTEIVPIPCSGTVPGLNPGDVIAVDYGYAVPSSLDYLETRWNFNVSVDYGWIRPYYTIDQTIETLLSGKADGFLNNTLSQRFGTYLRYDGQRLSANGFGEFQNYTSDRDNYNRFRLGEQLNFIVNPKMRVHASGDQFIQFTQDQNGTLMGANLRANLSYQWYPNLLSDAFAGMSYYNDSKGISEFNIQMGLGARWTYRLVEVIPRLEFFRFSRDQVTTNQLRFEIKLIRHF